MPERENRPSPTAILGDGLVLLCALLGLTASFLSLYRTSAAIPLIPLDWAADQRDQFLLWTALFALLSLGVWSLPRLRWAAAGTLAALWGLALWRSWRAVSAGACLTVEAVSGLFAQRVDWGVAFAFELGLSALEERAAVRLFLILALAGLALPLGWAVARGRRWWLAALLTLPPLLPGLLADLYPSWPPFLALCACWCALLLSSLCRRAAPSPRGRLTLVSLAASFLLLAGISLAFPREGYTRPPWARQAEESLTSFVNRMADWLPRWEDGPFHNTVTFVGSAEEADLAHAGPLNYTGRTVLQVKSDYEGRLYLRGTSLAVYEDGVWKPLPDGVYDGYSPAGSPQPVPLYFPAQAVMGDGRRVYTATVDNVGAVGACVYAPYHLTIPGEDAEDSGILPVEDAYLARKKGQWSHTMSFVEISRYSSFGLTSSVATPDDALIIQGGGGGTLDQAAQAAMERYGQFVREHCLDVPDELREELDAICLRIGSPYSLGGAVYAAEMTADYLDALCRYDQSAPAAPEGTDPVLYFLNESRRGYCMHYASAAVLLLRAMGVPARYASGFTAYSIPGRQAAVADRAAHAWVEVWVDGLGWYPVEVTPAAAFEQLIQPIGPEPGTESGPPPDATPEPTATPQPTQGPGETPAPTQGPSGPGGEGEVRPARSLLPWLKGLAAAGGGLGLLWLVQFAVKRHRRVRMSDPDRNRAALYAYRCLEELARWGGSIDPQGVELAEKAKFSPHTLTEEEAAALRRLVDRERARLAAGPSRWRRLLFRYAWGRPPHPAPESPQT